MEEKDLCLTLQPYWLCPWHCPSPDNAAQASMEQLLLTALGWSRARHQASPSLHCPTSMSLPSPPKARSALEWRLLEQLTLDTAHLRVATRAQLCCVWPFLQPAQAEGLDPSPWQQDTQAGQ